MVWSVQDAQWSSNLDRVRRCLAVSRGLPESQCHDRASLAFLAADKVHADECRVDWSGEGVGEAKTVDFLREGQIFLEGGDEEAGSQKGRSWRQNTEEQGMRERTLLHWRRNQKTNVRRGQLRPDRLVMMQQLPLTFQTAAPVGSPPACCVSDREGGARSVPDDKAEPRMRLLPSPVLWQAAQRTL